MPLKLLPNETIYSKKIKLPSGYNTLALYARNNKTGKVRQIELRACLERSDGTLHCPRGETHPQERKAIAKKIGIYKELYGNGKKINYNNMETRESMRQSYTVRRGGSLPIVYNTQRQPMYRVGMAVPIFTPPLKTLRQGYTSSEARGGRRKAAPRRSKTYTRSSGGIKAALLSQILGSLR